jgi:hypothetical protein
MTGQPIVVSYGMGTDSTAMLILLYELGIRPDLILFADTGGEKPGTYDYLETMNLWLVTHDFPRITVVKLRSKHASLEDNCLANFTLPSLAYGRKGCSLKWKVAAMDTYVNSWQPGAVARALGMTVVRAIGYDAGPADSRRSDIEATDRWTYWYPLRDSGMTREDCIALIAREGLPQPGKSACFYCPATRKEELIALLDHHPDLVARALKMEAYASTRGYKKSTKGLGRTWNWRDYLAKACPERLEALAKEFAIGQDLLPLAAARQTSLFDADAGTTTIEHTKASVESRWFSVPQIARVLRLSHREAAARVRGWLADGSWLSDWIEEHGVRCAVFRPRVGNLVAA